MQTAILSVTLFDCNHKAQYVMAVLWQMQKFMCYYTVFAFINFEFEDNFQQPLLGFELCKQQYIVSDTF